MVETMGEVGLRDVAVVFTGPADPDWTTDRDYLAHDIRDEFQ